MTSQTRIVVVLLVCALLPRIGAGQPANTPRAASIADAISVVRFQFSDVGAEGGWRWATFSPDGSRFAAVISRADTARDVNVHSLLLFNEADVGRPGAASTPSPIVSFDYAGDPNEQFLSPISHITILGDNRTIAFLGRKTDAHPQLFTVDAVTREVRQKSNFTAAVSGYVMAPDGSPRLYAIEREDSAALAQAKNRRGALFPLDRTENEASGSEPVSRFAVVYNRPRSYRQYVLASTGKVVLEDREESGIATLTGDPTGRFALVFPFRNDAATPKLGQYDSFREADEREQRLSTPYGLIDLGTGDIRPLINAPHPVFGAGHGGGSPIWSPSGETVLIHTMLPLTGSDSALKAKAPAQWVEVEVSSGRINSVPVPSQWHPVYWEARSGSIIIAKGNELARITKRAGAWVAPKPIGKPEGLPSLHVVFDAATNGRIVVGVNESPTVPSELAAFDLSRRTLSVLTEVNAHLGAVRHAPAEAVTWSGPISETSKGYLFRPLDAEPGRRYPLVILLDDGCITYGDPPYMMAGGLFHLNSHPVQALAAAGIAVLYTAEPAALQLSDRSGESKEGQIMIAHVENAIEYLDKLGLIDTARVGLAGWSRAGYHTDYVVLHGKRRLAAAITEDGGTWEYHENRPYTDAELLGIRTAFLMIPHGPAALVSYGGNVDRLRAMGKPVELLYLPTASHSAERPSDRTASLGVSLDWYRFWLQDHEDPSPEKARLYERWRALRDGGAK